MKRTYNNPVKHLILFLFLSVTAAHTQAQFTISGKNANLLTEQSNGEWLYFKPGTNISATVLLQKTGDLLGLSAENNFVMHRSSASDGIVHSRYNHFYKGFRVMYSELITHEKDQQLTVINGHVPATLSKPVNVQIAESDAFQKAVSAFGALRYSWQEQRPGILLPARPAGELVWVQPQQDKDPYHTDSYTLAWKFDIVSAMPVDAKAVFIHAASGAVVRVTQLMATCTGTTVQTSFNGSRPISTQFLSGTTYRLTNDCSTVIEEVNGRHNTYYQKSGNTWTQDTMRAAATSLWAMKTTVSYFQSIHSYTSWDNGNGGLRNTENTLFCYTNGCTGYDPNNASFYRGFMYVGWGNTSDLGDDWNCLDIVGHEFTHGISDTMAHLVYANESGALNESFSDIFGNTIQLNELGSVPNVWRVAEDRTDGFSSLYIRDMSNPASKGDPDTYKVSPWFSGVNDNGGVHTNSGVQNYMYYLLAVGGEGNNGLNNFYRVEGIGILPARRIAFKALVDYFDPNATYQTARSAWLQAAQDLFGIASNEYRQVANAWYAVGVCANWNEEYIVECGTKTFGAPVTTFYGYKYIYLANACTYTVNPGAGFVVYKAATAVFMKPGFQAKAGSNVRVSISPCTVY